MKPEDRYVCKGPWTLPNNLNPFGVIISYLYSIKNVIVLDNQTQVSS